MISKRVANISCEFIHTHMVTIVPIHYAFVCWVGNPNETVLVQKAFAEGKDIIQIEIPDE